MSYEIWFKYSLGCFLFAYSSNDDSPFGPLTQRLVTALIEENMMPPIDDTMADISVKGNLNTYTYILLHVHFRAH